MRKSLTSLLITVSIIHASAQTVTWTGNTSTNYFTTTNWNPATNTAALAQTEVLMIGTGSPNNCIHTGGSSANAYRPAKLNTLSGGNFTCNGTLYPWGSDSLNGTVTINAPGDFSSRNIIYIGRNGTATVNINSGSLSSKNGTFIATGNSGSAATVTVSGTLNVGGGGTNMDLSLANATGLAAWLNIYGGTVNIARNLLIGTNGHIFITGIGLLKIAGDKQSQLNGLIGDGRLTCTAGETLTIAYDGTNTTARITPVAGTMITEYTDSVVLHTGTLTCVIEKYTGNILSYRFNGMETVANLSADTKKFAYHDFTTSKGFETVWGCSFAIVENDSNMAHIVLKRPYTPSIGHVTPVDAELHYMLKKSDKGVYVYSKLEHKPSYPAFDIGSWRQVWWIAHNSAGVNLCERIYTDSLRSWEMPSNADYAAGSASGIAEIIKLNTGARAGKYDGKYEYSLRFWDNPVWGHASNINSIGCWMVNASCEYYNEGPMHHDLNAAAGIIHQCLNGVHYGDMGMVADTLTNWSKVYGPYLLLFTDKSSGDSNWAAAKQRQVIEKSLWPYAWVKDTVSYPPASLRGALSGRYMVSDAAKPGFSGAGAWIGVTDLSDGATNFQYECKNYQYWVKTDSSGNFTIPNIRPGTYSLFAFVDGATGEYRQDNVVVTAGTTTGLGAITRTIDRNYGGLVWEIGVPNRMASEFKMGAFDYCEGFVQKKFIDSFPSVINYNTALNNWSSVLPYAHTKYPDTAFNPAAQWRWRLNFTLPAGVPTTGYARLTIAYASNDHAQQWIYVNNETTPFITYYPDNGDGDAFVRQANYAKYSLKQVLIPMSRLVAGSNTISLIMPSNSGWLSHIMYDYLSLEANLSSALRIDLLYFKANAIAGKRALLDWKTTNEQNNDHFDIERSADGTGFASIGSVAATGTAGGSYSFTDGNPRDGMNYYRLRQVDNDGTYTYSPIEAVKFDPERAILVYPNPVKDVLTVSAEVMLKQIRVSSADGRTLFLQSGINDRQATINMDSFAKGIYYLEVRTATGIAVKKIVK